LPAIICETVHRAGQNLFTCCDFIGNQSWRAMTDTSQKPRKVAPLALGDYPLFHDLDADALARLAARAVRRRVSKHTSLFAKGDPADALIGIVEGSVKISAAGADGREIMFNIMNAGEMFGEIAVLDRGPRSADATTMTACDLFFIDRRDLLALLREAPELALRIIELLCERTRRVSEQVEDVVFLAAGARLAKTLLRLTESAAASSAGATITQQELSQLVGLSREIVNRLLRDWERAGCLSLDRNRVCVRDPAALAGFAARAR
jgi:CRP/FNR family transcriptional regulator, cyclic AMP receptor protein